VAVGTPLNEWPTGSQELDEIAANWDGQVGDCRQELVFIGQYIDFELLGRELDSCLLTEQEMVLGKDAWRHFNDPFGSWVEEEVA
jgi:hypothetical protein